MKVYKGIYEQLINEDIVALNKHLPDCAELGHIEHVLRDSIRYYYPIMESFESAYQKAIKESDCNHGEAFARFMFKAGADNLIEQAVFNSEKKHQQGMDFMKHKAIDAFLQFVKQYCAESGRKDISEDSEHYVKVFKELINS